MLSFPFGYISSCRIKSPYKDFMVTSPIPASANLLYAQYLLCSTKHDPSSGPLHLLLKPEPLFLQYPLGGYFLHVQCISFSLLYKKAQSPFLYSLQNSSIANLLIICLPPLESRLHENLDYYLFFSFFCFFCLYLLCLKLCWAHFYKYLLTEWINFLNCYRFIFVCFLNFS